MPNRLTDNTGLYNHATWSDLTLELPDGRDVRVHRNILSQANGYFESLCKRLKLSSDRWSIKKIHLNALSPESAAAVITFVRAIYGFALPETKELVWASWFDIAKYAPTYLSRHAPEVAEEAAQKFMASCMGEPDPDVVVKILQKLDHHNCPPNARFVKTIRRYHEPQLLRNEKYRADPRLCDREALLRHIDNMLDKPEQGSVAV